MVLGKCPVPGRPTIRMIVGQGPIALAVGAGGGCLDIFTLLYPSSPLPPSLWETARFKLKYCLKGPLNKKQPTNQPEHQCGNLSGKSSPLAYRLSYIASCVAFMFYFHVFLSLLVFRTRSAQQVYRLLFIAFSSTLYTHNSAGSRSAIGRTPDS